MKKIIKLFLAFLILIFPLSLISCGSENFSINYGISQPATNVDPLLASNECEVAVVQNIFRGLFKLDESGKPVEDLIDKFTVSDDGLIYTFYLKDNLSWSNDYNLTASDFVFAIKRAASPNTKAKNTSLINNIVNAQNILDGSMSPSKIGVIALNDQILQISLIKPDNSFIYKLTDKLFFPCNEQFFNECKGKYGLNRKNIISNGNYKISYWDTNIGNLRITLNTKINDGLSHVGSVLFKYDSSDTVLNAIKNNKIDIGVLNCTEYSLVDNSKYAVQYGYDTVYFLYFNQNGLYGKSSLLCDSFAQSINRNELNNKVKNYIKITNKIIPNDISFSGVNLDIGTPTYKVNYEPEKARNQFLKEINKIKNFNISNTKILCDNSEDSKNISLSVLSDWQNNLGAYFTINSTDNLSFEVNDAEIALISATSKNKDIKEYLSLFSEKDSKIDYYNKNFEDVYSEILIENDIEKCVELIKEAENILINDSSLIPIAQSPTAYCFNSNYKNVKFDTHTGCIDFIKITY